MLMHRRFELVQLLAEVQFRCFYCCAVVPDCVVGNGLRFSLCNVRSTILWEGGGGIFFFPFLIVGGGRGS
jgi:hypothetical protein